jgi:RNA 2',3'-cyclic 3'-phosphodiesterase
MRLFVAIDINKVGVEKLQNYLSNKLKFNSRNVKPIKKENLHITMKFLGEKTDAETKDIISELTGIRFDSFKILFDKMGVFPHMRSPRIIWLGLDDQSNKKLNDLYFQINDVLKKYDNGNNNSERKNPSGSQKFSPHLTIFRIHNNYMIPDFLSSPPDRLISEEEEVHTISLKKSTITPNGSAYSDLLCINATKRNAY